MNKSSLISAIIQAVCALIIIGIAIYYIAVDDVQRFAVFLIVGIVFLALSARTIYKYFKKKK